MGKTVTELHAMLKLHEQTLPPKEVLPTLHAIRAGRIQKNQKKKSHKAAKGNQGKGKAKMGYAPVQAPPFAPKPKNPPTTKKDNLAKGVICYQCGKVGHWRRNFPIYLAKLMKKRSYLKELALQDGFVNRFENDNSIFIFRNNLIYFNAIPRNDIYEIVLSSPNTNDSFMYVVSSKRAKLNLDTALLWHCHLGHISKKRIEKLQHDRLLDSTDIKSFEKYVFCMYGKMARKPYSHQEKRATYIIRLIHTDEHRIIAHQIPLYMPQHNGVLKRRNRTLLDMVRSIMSQTTLPKSFWDYALESDARILNMVPTKQVDKTPYEVWHGKAPKMSYLKVWGCEELVKRNTLTKSDKLEPRAFKYIFNAEFFKNNIIDQEASGSLEDLEIIQEEDTHTSIDTSLNHKEDDQEIDEPQIDINPICRSTRTRRNSDRMCLYIDAEEHELGDLVHTYKARLVAKDFTQTPGIDYEETFSSVEDIRAIMILIARDAFYDYEIWQMDVKTAFHNRYLEEVYMEQPEDFVNQKFPNQRLQNIPYALAVGSIMYVVRCTHSDVAFAQNITSRFQQNPGEVHWTAVKNILKYICNTKDMFLVYGGDTKRELMVSCYTDAGYLTDADDMKLGVVLTIEEPINMYCDNIGAIAIAKDHGVTKGARHFRAKVHYLRETIEMGDVRIEKVDTYDNLADPFTKALAFPKHSELTKKIGMIPATSTTLVVNKKFVPPLDKCRKIPGALSRINQMIAWPYPKEIVFELEHGVDIVKEGLSHEKFSQGEVMQDLTASFDNIVKKLSQVDQEGTNEAAVKEGMNDVVQEEMIGVGHDTDYDASISGKEAHLETFMEVEDDFFQQDDTTDRILQDVRS
uniref:Retrotransposon protein, putative, Ty1-copia subclass n=1 Tax=Tanacetum cinerariifolium TaxID=118510 RepID=A0A6L2MGN5_TANCI|nr:hypothetical protein [Tanacetum cinerariifolium]